MAMNKLQQVRIPSPRLRQKEALQNLAPNAKALEHANKNAAFNRGVAGKALKPDVTARPVLPSQAKRPTSQPEQRVQAMNRVKSRGGY